MTFIFYNLYIGKSEILSLKRKAHSLTSVIRTIAVALMAAA